MATRPSGEHVQHARDGGRPGVTLGTDAGPSDVRRPAQQLPYGVGEGVRSRRHGEPGARGQQLVRCTSVGGHHRGAAFYRHGLSALLRRINTYLLR